MQVTSLKIKLLIKMIDTMKAMVKSPNIGGCGLLVVGRHRRVSGSSRGPRFDEDLTRLERAGVACRTSGQACWPDDGDRDGGGMFLLRVGVVIL